MIFASKVVFKSLRFASLRSILREQFLSSYNFVASRNFFQFKASIIIFWILHQTSFSTRFASLRLILRENYLSSYKFFNNSFIFFDIMTDLINQYVSQIKILCSNLIVNFKYSADDLNINKDSVFRNTTAFVNQIEIFRRRYVFNSWYVIHVCLQKIVYKWYVNAPKHIRKTINNDSIDQLCEQLLTCDKAHNQIKLAISKVIKSVSSDDELNYYTEASFAIKSNFVSISSFAQDHKISTSLLVKFILFKFVSDTLTNELDMKDVKCNNIYSAKLKLKADLRKIRDMIIT